MPTTLPQHSHRITLEKAVKMTTLYRNEKDNIISPEYRGKEILCYSETFNRKAFDDLLAQKECAGIRIYYSMDDTLKLSLIAVGVNAANEEILPVLSAPAEDGDEGIIIDEGAKCPPECSEPSPLRP